MTRIVVLDAVPADNGDMDWSAVEALGELTKYDATAQDERAERVRDCEVLLVNKVAVDREIIAAAKNLKMIGVLATGYDNIDVEAARGAGITVCNVPGYSTSSTAQLAITLLLQLAYRTGEHSRAFHNGEWADSGTFTFWKHPLVELDGKTLAIVGLGAIGSRTAASAEALGMKVVAAQLPGRPAGTGPYPRLPLLEAIRTADAISLHCPLTDGTRHLFDAELLAEMKPSAFLINVGRGPLVDVEAAAKALHANEIAGFATDVLDEEPPQKPHVLQNVPNCLVTPHIGWASRESRTRLLNWTADNIREFLAGTPQNVVGER